MLPDEIILYIFSNSSMCSLTFIRTTIVNNVQSRSTLRTATLLKFHKIKPHVISSPHTQHAHPSTYIHQMMTQYSWKHLCRVTASLSKCTVWQNVLTFVHHVTHSHRHCKASVPLKSFQVILTVRQDVFSPFVHTTSSLSVMGCIEPWEFDTSHLRPPVPRKTTHLRAIY